MLMVATACLAGYVWAKMMKGVGMRLMPYSVADALQCWVREDPPIILGPLSRGASLVGLCSESFGGKGNPDEMERMMPDRETPRSVPVSILAWLHNPVYDNSWSDKILADMEKAGVEVIKRC